MTENIWHNPVAFAYLKTMLVPAVTQTGSVGETEGGWTVVEANVDGDRYIKILASDQATIRVVKESKGDYKVQYIYFHL